MVKNFGTKLGSLATGTIEESIIQNEYVWTLFICKILHFVIDDCRCQSCGKFKPIRFSRVQKSINCILGKILFEGASAHLHIHAAVGKYILKSVTKQRDSRNTFFFRSVTFFQKFSHVVFGKKSVNAIKNGYLFISVLCYNGHGINPPMVVGFSTTPLYHLVGVYAFFIGWSIEFSRYNTPYWCGKFK